MKRTALIGTTIIALAIGGVAWAQWSYTLADPFEAVNFVGTSSTYVAGDAGVLGMTAACHLDHPRSRMCTSQEIMESYSLYDFGTTDAAWVRPAFQPIGGLGAVSKGYYRLDLSGVWDQDGSYQGLSCFGWNNAASVRQGLTVSPSGGFNALSCDVARPVACCAKVKVPEPGQSSGLVVGILSLGMLGRWRSN